MEPLTRRQQLVLNYIKDYIKAEGCPPTRTDIAAEFDMHPNGAQYHLKALARRGAIELLPYISRGIRLPKPGLPVVNVMHVPARAKDADCVLSQAVKEIQQLQSDLKAMAELAVITDLNNDCPECNASLVVAGHAKKCKYYSIMQKAKSLVNTDG